MKDKKQRIDQLLESSKDSMKSIIDNVYNIAWHDGRREDREKWSTSGYLIIDPDKQTEIDEILNSSPCKDCPFNTNGQFRIHCFKILKGEEICDKYKKFLFLSELKEYFGK